MKRESKQQEQERQNVTRQFSYARPTNYNGAWYPSLDVLISDGEGSVAPGRIFVDKDGKYYTLNEKGEAVNTNRVYNLDEVTVTGSQNLLAKRRKDMLTMSNDKTQVNNVHHRAYNSNLREVGLKGAREHALWEKEHPNLSSWRDAVTFVPFAVAAAPAVIGGSEYLLGTGLGQTVVGLGNRAMSSTIANTASTALGLGFAANGAYDVSQGDFTPQTALDLTGSAALITKGVGMLGKYLTARNAVKNTEPAFVSELDWSPERWFKTRTGNVGYDAEDIAALKSHIPEYLQIEQQSKANGTWLKMPDGTTWKGDPRSWVQMMSRAYDTYTGNSPFKYEVFAHSSEDVFDTFDLKYFGKTDEGYYGKGHYSHPAEYINGELRGKNSYGPNNYLLTTNVQKPLDLNNPDFQYADLFNRENTNAPLGVLDNYDSVYYGIPGVKTIGASPAELVVPKSTNYKSLLGNNGVYNSLNPNIYKGLVPFGVSVTALGYPQNK